MKYQYELMCLSRECEGRTIEIFPNICKACEAIGTVVECPECADEFEVTESNIFVRKRMNDNKHIYNS